MRAKIHYYMRFIFGFSTQEVRGFYVLWGLILSFFLFQYYLRYEQEAEDNFRFEPEVWDAALVKLPVGPEGKNFYKTYPQTFRGKSTFFKRGVFPKDSRVTLRRSTYLNRKNTGFNRSWTNKSNSMHSNSNPVWANDSRANGSWANHLTPSSMLKSKMEKDWNLDINAADSTAWVGLKGIGPGFAKRIMAFRDRLGGFNSVMQLKEVYGLDSVWVEENKNHLSLGQGIFRQLMVNRATWVEFRHPYLPYAQAKIVLAYRKQHPLVTNFETLITISLLEPTVWLRLKPYLSFEP